MKDLSKLKHKVFEAVVPLGCRGEVPAKLSAEVDKMLELEPDNAMAHWLKGLVAYNVASRRRPHSLDNYQEALAILQRAFDIALNQYTFLTCDLVTTHFKMRRREYKEIAKQMIERVLTEEPSGRPCRHFQKAVFLASYRYDYRTAALEMKRAISIEGRSDSYRMCGFYKQMAADFDDALKDYDDAVRLDPQNHLAFQNRARLKIQLGDFQGAASDFAASVEIADPDSDHLWSEIAEAYMRAEWNEQAVGALDQAMGFYEKPSCPIAFMRAQAKERAGDLQGALQDLDIAAVAPGFKDKAAEMKNKISARLEDSDASS